MSNYVLNITYEVQPTNLTLLAKIYAAKKYALEQGRIIRLRKEDIRKTKLTGGGAKFAYSWYQTSTKVGIEIPFVVYKKYDLIIKFEPETVVIDFPLPEVARYHLDLVLFRKIIPPRSKVNHRLNSIEIVMEKEEQTEKWTFLRRDGLGIPYAYQKDENLYPSSNKIKKNWEKIGREIEYDMLKKAEEYGEDPTMNFFKQIYGQGDYYKRKAMIKSFQTSGGTVLSTDWNDISKKDYEGKDRVSPPKGQYWRKPEI